MYHAIPSACSSRCELWSSCTHCGWPCWRNGHRLGAEGWASLERRHHLAAPNLQVNKDALQLCLHQPVFLLLSGIGLLLLLQSPPHNLLRGFSFRPLGVPSLAFALASRAVGIQACQGLVRLVGVHSLRLTLPRPCSKVSRHLIAQVPDACMTTRGQCV